VTDALDAPAIGGGLFELYDAESGETLVVDGWGGVDSTVDERLRTLTRCGARAFEISTEVDPYLRMHLHFQKMGSRR
jgi:hypothetical protein